MSPRAAQHSPDGPSRPRVEGDREHEILMAALSVLADAGYDRLTMDAVATEAKASKATLYRRWNGKAALVIDALLSQKEQLTHAPDTGSLRGDLLAAFCGTGGLIDKRQIALLGSVITAIGHDEEFAAEFRRQFIAPKQEINREIFTRALERGEIRPDVDLDLIIPALPGIVLHRKFLLGEAPTEEAISRVIDQVILPAVTPHPTTDPEGSR